MVYILLSFCLFYSCTDPVHAPSEPGGNEPPTAHTERFQLNNGMVIDVFTPENYDNAKTYPLLILNDGEQMFGPVGWNMHTRLQSLIDEEKIVPIIAVAIHAQGNRNDWYIPYEDTWVSQNWGAYTPKADEYADDIFKTVIPFLNDKFSINASEVGILGASLGGLISNWMGLKFPNQIKYSAGLSGSLWVADYSVFGEVEGPYNEGQKFWFDIGTEEWNYYVPLYSSLNKAGVMPGKNNFYYEVPNASHITIDWLRRIHYPLITFFGVDKNPEPESLQVILECIPSQSSQGVYFRRMNPIITQTNGVKFSLAHAASYQLTSGDAQLGTEGSFRNNPETEVKILVEYETFSETVTIPKGWCY